MGEYRRPEKRIHRGFFYLNDETVINSLSAVEAGKVDEVVARVNLAREGSFGGSVGIQAAKLEGGKKGSSELEEEIVRTRTRFSVFELWYQTLVDGKALGRFDGWGPEILKNVRPGDTVELDAELEIAALPQIFRMFFWYAAQARETNGPFSQKGEALKETRDAERNMRLLAGGSEDLMVIAKPSGDMGPPVIMTLADEWMIGKLGHLAGTYAVVGQVDQVLNVGESTPAIRLTQDIPPTPLELNLWRESLGNFTAPAAALGIEVSEADAAIDGPAMWITPAAIFR
jgi:hypothetical protein